MSSLIKVQAWITALDRYKKAMLLLALAGGGLVTATMVGGMLATGAITAAILVASSVFTLGRLKPAWRRWLLKHPLVTNIAATGAVSMIVGVGSTTGIVIIAMSFLGVDIAQKVAGLLSDAEDEIQLAEAQSVPSRIVDTKATVVV